MFLEVNFNYWAIGTMPHGQVERDLKLSDTVAVEIAEVDRDEMFLAARCVLAGASPRAVDIHAYAGRFWKASPLTENGPGVRHAMSPSELRAAVASGAVSPFSGVQKFNLGEMNPRGHGYRGRLSSSGRVNSVRDIEAVARATVSCDGAVLVDCGVPCYAIEGDWTLHALLATDEALTRRKHTLVNAAAVHDFVARNPDLAPTSVHGRVETLRPDLVQLPETGDLEAVAGALILAARRAKGVLERHLPQGTRDDFDLFATLRDEIRACPQGEITPTLEATIREVAGLRPREYGAIFQVQVALDQWTRQMAEAMDRVAGYRP